jgi:tetratricopeptide (TPR) repeat protein
MKNKKPALILRVVILAAVIAAAPILRANNLPFAHDISVKNAGSSGALSPFINDAYSPYVNPAGLGLTERQEISGFYYNLFMDSILSSVSYALPLLDAGSIGASVLYFGTGDIAGLDIYNQPDGTSYSETYINLSLSYGISLFSLVNAGMTLKILNHNLAGSGNSAYGIDLGAIAMLPYDMRLSFLLENAIKPEFKYASSESDLLPVFFDATLSGTYKLNLLAGLNDSVKAGAGLDMEEFNSTPGWHAGAEYSVYDGMAALRLGIKNSGFSFGGSISYQGASFDYAYVKTAYDFIHKFSLSYGFGENIRALELELKTKEDKLKYGLIQKIREETLVELKQSISNSMANGDAETALAAVQKALVWAPYDGWFKEKEQEIAGLINKDKKDRMLSEADSLIKQGSYIDALVALKNVLDIEPGNAAAKEKFNSTSQFVKTTSEKNLFLESLNKDSIKKYFETGLDYYASGQYEKAVKEWDNVIQASPLQGQVYDLISKAKERVGKLETQAKNIVILKQQKLTGLYNEAVMLHTKGKFEESINIWRQILELDPANTEAKEYLKKVTEEYKKIQRQNLEW